MGIPPPVQLDTLSMPDTLILMVLALVVFGPRRLPKIGRQLGKLMYEFRKASNDFKFQMEEELRQAEEADRRKKEEEERQRALAAAPAPQIESASAAPTAQDQSLCVQPPSTGETIMADRPAAAERTGATELPGTHPGETELFDAPPGDPGDAPDEATPESEASEPAAHHAHTNG